MHKLTFFAILLFSVQAANAQENYLEEIANKACSCIQEKKDNQESVTKAELGICLFKYAGDYQTQFKEDHDIDLNDLGGNSGVRLGEVLGAKMMFVCPDLLVEFSSDEEAENAITGTITNIFDETNVLIEITTPDGKRQKFYWLTFIETDFDIQNSYNELKGKNVTIKYVERDIFDPRINEYRTFGVISSLELLQ